MDKVTMAGSNGAKKSNKSNKSSPPMEADKEEVLLLSKCDPSSLLKHFETKILPIKKKNPQKLIKHYFSVVKPIQEKVEKNFQGFPMPMCRHCPQLDKWVYCPPCYYGSIDFEDRIVKTCEHCFLRPCVTIEKDAEICEFAGDAIGPAEGDVDKYYLYSKSMDYVESLMVEIFGRRYVRRSGVPGCVPEVLFDCLNIDRNDWHHPDDELFANSEESCEITGKADCPYF